METPSIYTERVDDIPVLYHQITVMQLIDLIDEHFRAHGNWQGLSPGTVVAVWLTHILSEANHKLNHVQPWVEQRLEILRRLVDPNLQPWDFTDDRLALLLRAFSDDLLWADFERSLNQRLIRVYDLSSRRVRLDATTASSYRDVSGEGLFQRGHSKDHRPDLGQLKIMMATLDPLGMPLVTQIVPGNRADDPLYLPAIEAVNRSLMRTGLLYIGDCKMAALETRATLFLQGNSYLCPLSATQWPIEQQIADLTPVWNGDVALTEIQRTNDRGEVETVAEGFEEERTVTAKVGERTVTYVERHLRIRSLTQAHVEAAGLRKRVATAMAKLAALNERKHGKRRFESAEAVRGAAEAILTHHRVGDVVTLEIHEARQERPVRTYGDRPERVDVTVDWTVEATIDEAVLAEAIRRKGWRTYVTIEPGATFGLDDAVWAYREEYQIERGFGRLKGKPLSLMPMYLMRDDHATGLVRLLTIGLRVLTLLEFVVRRALAETKDSLVGLYKGQPTRKTPRPTAEALLRAFEGITLTVVTHAEGVIRHLTPQSPLQRRILELLGVAPDFFGSAILSNSP